METNYPEGNGIGHGISFNCLLFVDDLAIVEENEDDLPYSSYQLFLIYKDYNLTIPCKKTISSVFVEKDQTLLNSQLIELVRNFSYLG